MKLFKISQSDFNYLGTISEERFDEIVESLSESYQDSLDNAYQNTDMSEEEYDVLCDSIENEIDSVRDQLFP